ncbi:MAG TPA: aromatic ring-opening dioxygenase LigA [Acidimicrobiia bacterium]|nr:aromatic ring-opening dioxygenase LigA [Acidimicrobiia bacterium]
MRKTAYITSVVLGIVLIAGGIATWVVVSSTLGDQNITVSEDASCLAGDEVNGPLSAYCEAQIIEVHALEATDGLTYAELPRESELRPVAMNASFLRASLFTSVVAFGVAGMAILMGIVFVLIGLGMRDVGAKTGEL